VFPRAGHCSQVVPDHTLSSSCFLVIGPSFFPPQLRICISFLPFFTCPSHLILLHLIILIRVFGEWWMLWRSYAVFFFHLVFMSFVIGPNPHRMNRFFPFLCMWKTDNKHNYDSIYFCLSTVDGSKHSPNFICSEICRETTRVFECVYTYVHLQIFTFCLPLSCVYWIYFIEIHFKWLALFYRREPGFS